MEKVRIGMIGCGYWGPNLTRNFIELPNSEVVIAADLRKIVWLRSRALIHRF